MSHGRPVPLHQKDESVARDEVTATNRQAGQSQERMTHDRHAPVRDEDTPGQVDVVDRWKSTHHVIEKLVGDLRFGRAGQGGELPSEDARYKRATGRACYIRNTNTLKRTCIFVSEHAHKHTIPFSIQQCHLDIGPTCEITLTLLHKCAHARTHTHTHTHSDRLIVITAL